MNGIEESDLFGCEDGDTDEGEDSSDDARAKRVLGEMKLAGLRPPYRNELFLPGPFVFMGVVTDNATTESNLKADANNVDQALELHIGSGANAPGILHIEAIEFCIEKGTESEVVFADILESIYLRHVFQGGEARVSLAPYARTTMSYSVAADSTASTLVARHALTRYDLPRKLAQAWQVDLEADSTFAVAMRAAVDSGANVPFQMYVNGGAWRNTDYRRYVPRCPSHSSDRLARLGSEIAAAHIVSVAQGQK